jgi:predicted small secreted protein
VHAKPAHVVARRTRSASRGSRRVTISLHVDPDQLARKPNKLIGVHRPAQSTALCYGVAAAVPTKPRYLWGVRQRPGIWKSTRTPALHKKLIVALAMLSVVAVAPLLSACHTTAGAGQDISATGQAIDKAAKKATP